MTVTDTPSLPELAGRIDHLRGQVLRAFDEAGPEFDVAQVTVFSGTPDAKLDQIRQADRELNQLQQLVEARLDLLGTITPADGAPAPAKRRKNIGRLFTESDAYKRRATGAAADLDLELGDLGIGVKSTLTLPTTADIPYPGTGLVELTPEQPPNLAEAIPNVSFDHWRVRYLQETSATNAAGQVAETDLYPEAALDLEEVLKRLQKVGVIIPTTEELLEDEASAQGYLNQRLGMFCQEQLDDQLLNGDGTGQNLLGFHSTPGINTHDYAPGSLGQDMIAAILAGAGLVATNGKAVADSVVIGAEDWWALLATQTTNGDFVFDPTDTPGFFGLKPVLTVNQASGRFLVGALNQHATLFSRAGIEIAISTQHEDYFARGQIAIRAKLPAWLAVFRPAAFTEVNEAS